MVRGEVCATLQNVKLGHFHTAGPRVRAACLTFWLLFLWLYPVAMSAASGAEEGHACCRRGKHSCCKKSGKGAEIGSRSCGVSCPALEKFQQPGVAPGLPAPAARVEMLAPETAAARVEAVAAVAGRSTPKQCQRPPPRA